MRCMSPSPLSLQLLNFGVVRMSGLMQCRLENAILRLVCRKSVLLVIPSIISAGASFPYQMLLRVHTYFVNFSFLFPLHNFPPIFAFELTVTRSLCALLRSILPFEIQ